MTQPYRIEPDLEFIRDVIGSGGDTLKKCFQCATCSVVCPLSPEKSPFPRKEMIQAQWGLKEKLVKNPDIWLCHNCNDCSTYCPRGAKPGDVLNVIRQKAIAFYSWPSVLAKKVGDPKALPLLLGAPALLFLLVIFFANSFGQSVIVTHGKEMQIEGLIRSWKMIPMLAVDTIFILTSLFAVGILANGVFRFWKDLDSEHKRTEPVVPGAIAVIKEIMTHSNFKECDTNQDRYLGHLGIFYGFVALAIVTGVVFASVYFIGPLFHVDAMTPWSILNPVKLLANLGGIALLVGCYLIFKRRLQEDKDTTTSYYDWFLLGQVLAIGASGMLAEIVRWMGLGFLYYIIYFIHLIAVWSLFAYAPFSKIAHLVYRTVALVHARACGRQLLKAPEVVHLSGAAVPEVSATEAP